MDHLSSHPDYQRRGIGTLLLNAVIRKIDEANLELYVESTEIGVPFYETIGACVVRNMRMVNGGVRVAMVRPKSSKSRTRVV